MNGVLERTLAILEYLATQAEATPLTLLADELEIPRSACHRLLSDLVRCGYVRQMREHGDYILTTKLVGLGLGYRGRGSGHTRPAGRHFRRAGASGHR